MDQGLQITVENMRRRSGVVFYEKHGFRQIGKIFRSLEKVEGVDVASDYRSFGNTSVDCDVTGIFYRVAVFLVNKPGVVAPFIAGYDIERSLIHKAFPEIL